MTPRYDLAFVGAGASTSYTLLGLLSELSATGAARPVDVVVVERGPDAFSGLPYGDRAARTCLLITALRDFLPEAERSAFSSWLARNKGWVFDEFCSTAGPLGTTWWERHREEIARDDFDDLFLPRYTFGAYLKERVRDAVAHAAAAGTATVTVLRDDVRAVRSTDDGHHLEGGAHSVTAGQVVLAVGSPPPTPRLAGWDTGSLLLDDPFADLPDALRQVADALAAVPADRAPHVVVLGSNASAMDLVYQVNDIGGPAVERLTMTVLAPRGELPTRMEPPSGDTGFRAEHLDLLTTAPTLRAVDVYAAALGDIERGRQHGLSAATTLAPISRAVGELVGRLPLDEMAEFAGRWGAQLGRHQRRAGQEYWEVVDHLTAQDRLVLVAGAFTGLDVEPDGTTRVVHQGADGPVRLDRPADVVINCAGPSGDLRVGAPAPLDQLFADGLCRESNSGAGIAVGQQLEAADGLHVMGPLLAGNVVAGRPIWHMEHCGRISVSGQELGRRLAAVLGRG